MLRSIANGIFVLCMAAWGVLALLLCVTLFEYGPGAIKGKLIHVAGTTGQLGVESGNLVVWRLLGLLLITVVAWYFRRSQSPKLSNP